MKKNIIKKEILTDTLVLEKSSAKKFISNRSFSVKANSRANYILVADSSFLNDVNLSFILEKNSSLNIYYLFLSSTADNIWNFKHQIKEGAKINSRFLVLGAKKQNFPIQADFNFSDQKSFGRINLDSLLMDQSVLNSTFNVNVLPLAQKSDTRVDMILRLEGEEAKGSVTPGLNISANDVKAGHSAGTFKLKPEESFYLNSRGLNKKQIRQLFIMNLSDKFTKDIYDKKIVKEIKALIKSNL